MAASPFVKRLFDIVFSLAVLIVFSPLLITAAFCVWVQDFRSPLYLAPRVARGGGSFTMIKLRSMVVNADQTGVNSTGAKDQRITRVGHFIRRFKLDELAQFGNVLYGNMSVVGPRPNTMSEGVELYTPTEMRLLDAKPGITDLASIVFSDEATILASHTDDPDKAYNELIRPWKSRLGLFYVAKQSLLLDIQIVWLTAVVVLSRPVALRGVATLLGRYGAEPDLKKVCLRNEPLQPALPPQ